MPYSNMLEVEVQGPVLRLTLARPDVRNALNEELITLLSEQFENLAESVRVVVLSGEGKSFCAGADLEYMRRAATFTEAENHRDALRIYRLFRLITDCPAVVVTKVTGHAYGGGAGLVAASDIAIADENTLFAFSEVRLGLVPATISPFVIEKIGRSQARALFVTGESFTAPRALRIGLVHHLSADSEMEVIVEGVIENVLRSGPRAVSLSKELAVQPLLDGDEAARLLSRVRASSEAREGINAFLDRRKASFIVN